MILEREFQREGAEMEKALSPHVTVHIFQIFERDGGSSSSLRVEADFTHPP